MKKTTARVLSAAFALTLVVAGLAIVPPAETKAAEAAATTAAEVKVAEESAGVSAAVPAEVPVVPEIDLDGTYNAYIGLQTPKWSFRNPWNDATYGKETEFFNQVTGWDEANNPITLPGTIQDTVIAGNGTYTVSITDIGTFVADDFAAAGQDFFNLLFISTDIPLSDSISITDVTLKMDDKTITTYAEGYQDPDTTDYCKILIQNTWNEDVKEIAYYGIPATSIEMSFTVSGFNYDNAEQTAVVEEAVTTPAPAEETGTSAAVEEAVSAPVPVEEPADEGGSILPIVISVIVVAAGAAVLVVKKRNIGK